MTAHDWRVPLAGFEVVDGAAGQRLNAAIRDVVRRSYGEQVYFRILLHGVKLGDEPEGRIRGLLPGFGECGVVPSASEVRGEGWYWFQKRDGGQCAGTCRSQQDKARRVRAATDELPTQRAGQR